MVSYRNVDLVRRSDVMPTTFEVRLDPTELPVSLNGALVHSNPDAVVNGLVFGGLGFNGRSPRRAAYRAAREGVKDVMFVEAVPYNKAERTSNRLLAAGVSTVRAAANHARQEFGATLLHGIGESQQGPALALAAEEDPDAVDGALSFLHPLGSVKPMGKLEFAGRMALGAFQPEQAESPIAGLAVAGHSLLRVGEDLDYQHGFKGRFTQLEVALAHKIGPTIQSIAKAQPDRRMFVIAGEDDLAFRPEKMYDELEPYGLANMLVVIKGATHSTPAGRAGARLVHDAVNQWTADVIPAYQPTEAQLNRSRL